MSAFEKEGMLLKTLFCLASVYICAAGVALGGKPENPCLNPVRFERSPRGKAVTLVKEGAPAATIVIADEALKTKKGVEYQAAAELAAYVRLATGAELPIKSDTEEIAGTLILVGDSKRTEARKISAADLPMEGFRVTTFPDGLAIVGRQPDLKITPESKGTLWGVYDFLERYLGIRWYYPGDVGRVVPQAKSLVIDPVAYTDHPRRLMRSVYPPAPPQYRVATATYMNMFCHTPGNFGIHFNEAPECFEQRIDGTRDPGMPCYGNPKTVELMLRDIDNYLARGSKGPWSWDGTNLNAGLPPTERVVYISPPDKMVDCHCEYCSKLTDANARDLGRASLILAQFVSRMGLEIQKKWPLMTVGYLPYSNYTLPPENLKLPGNVVVSLCLMRGVNGQHPDASADHDRMIAGWVKATGRPIRLWEYPCWPQDDTALPFQYPHVIKEFQMRHPNDVEGSFLCTGYWPDELGRDGMWKSQAPTYYCWLRLLWNPDFNVDAALKEYVDLMFGPARRPMGRILASLMDRWESTIWKQPPTGHHASPSQINEETMPRAEALKLRDWLAEARTLAAEGTLERRRVDFFGQAVEVFLKESETYHEGGKNLPALTVLKVGGNPKLDGKLDDPCWKDAVAQPFVMSRDAKAPDADKATTVQAVWTEQGVIFGFKLLEPDVTRIKASFSQHDQDIYFDDCVEIFLDVEGRRSKYYQIIANSVGALYDGTAAGKEWNAEGAKAVVHKDKDFWSIEVFVPFSDFPEKPQVKIGSVWYGNFCRTRYMHPEPTIQRWSTLKRYSNLDFSAFGKLRFVE